MKDKEVDKVKVKLKLNKLDIGFDRNYDIRCKTLLKSNDTFRLFEAFIVSKKSEVPVYLIQLHFLDASLPFINHLSKRVEEIYSKFEESINFKFERLFAKRLGYYIKEDENYLYLVYEKGAFNLASSNLLNLLESNNLIKLQVLEDISYYCMNLHKINRKMSLIHPDLILFNKNNDAIYYFDFIFDEFFKEINKTDNYHVSSNIGYLDLDSIDQIDSDIIIFNKSSTPNVTATVKNVLRTSTYNVLERTSYIKNCESDVDDDEEEQHDTVNELQVKKQYETSDYFKTDIVMLNCLTVWLFSKKCSGDKNNEYPSFEQILYDIKKDFLLENSTFPNLLSNLDNSNLYIKQIIQESLNLDYKKISNIDQFREKLLKQIQKQLENAPCVKCKSKTLEIKSNAINKKVVTKNLHLKDNMTVNNVNKKSEELIDQVERNQSIQLSNKKINTLADTVRTSVNQTKKTPINSKNENSYDDKVLEMSKLDIKNNKDAIISNQREILALLKDPKNTSNYINETINDISDNKPKVNNSNLFDVSNQSELNQDKNCTVVSLSKVNDEVNIMRFNRLNKIVNYTSLEIVCEACIDGYIPTKQKSFKENLMDRYLKYQESYLKIKSIYNSIPTMNEKQIKKYYESNIHETLSQISNIINSIMLDINVNNNKVNSLIEYHEKLIHKLINFKESSIHQCLDKYKEELEYFNKEIVNSENYTKYYPDVTIINSIPRERIEIIHEKLKEEEETYELEQERLKRQLFNMMQGRNEYLTYEKVSKEKFNDFFSSIKKLNLLKVSMNYEKDLKIALEKLKNECNGFCNDLDLTVKQFDKILNEYRVESPYITEKNKNDVSVLENVNVDTIYKHRIGAYSCGDRTAYVFDSNDKYLYKLSVSKIKGISGTILGSKYININGKLVITGGIITNTNNSLLTLSKNENIGSIELEVKEPNSPYKKYNKNAKVINAPNCFNANNELSNKSFQILDFALYIDLETIKRGDTLCSFEVLPSMKSSRFHHSIAKLNDYSFIVVGGEENSTCEEFSFLLQKWIEKPSLITPKYHSSLILVNGTDLYLFFGLIGTGMEKGKPSYTIEKISLYSNKPEWKKVSFDYEKNIDIDICLSGLAQVSDDRLIIFGGNSKPSKGTLNTNPTIFLKYDLKRKHLTKYFNDEKETDICDPFFDEGTFLKFSESDFFIFSSEFNLVSINAEDFLN